MFESPPFFLVFDRRPLFSSSIANVELTARPPKHRRSCGTIAMRPRDFESPLAYCRVAAIVVGARTAVGSPERRKILARIYLTALSSTPMQSREPARSSLMLGRDHRSSTRGRSAAVKYHVAISFAATATTGNLEMSVARLSSLSRFCLLPSNSLAVFCGYPL